jgi:2'-5' RNA ligase
MRSFLAVEIPPIVKEALGSARNQLRDSGADVKWVNPHAIHLTLKFLGEIEPAMADEIRRCMEPALRNHDPFVLEVRGMGCFPGLRQPRVVWVGLSGDLERLGDLQREVEEGTTRLGFPPQDRPFWPHLTLGRVRSARGRDRLVDRIQDLLEVRLGTFTVESLLQFQSELHPSGARYTPLWELPLGGPG